MYKANQDETMRQTWLQSFLFHGNKEVIRMNEQQRNGLVPSFLIKINVHSPKKKKRERKI